MEFNTGKPTTPSVERQVARWCGVVTALLGIAGLVGYGFGIPLLTRVNADYKPLALSVAIFLIILGLIISQIAAANMSRRKYVFLITMFAFISLYSLLEVIGLILGADLNLENALTTRLASATSIPFDTMSPVAGLLLCLVGVAAMLALSRSRSGGFQIHPHRLGDAAGALGLIVGIIALIFNLGYAYGTPLLYGGGPIIPAALTATLGALLLAVATVAVVGREHWPLRAIVGDSTRARLMRAFVPLVIITVLIISIAEHWLAAIGGISHVLEGAAATVIFALVAGIMASRAAKAIGNIIDQARETQQKAETSLREAKETLEIHVQKRTTELESAVLALQEEALERRRAEETVRAERQRFNDVFETLPAYLVLLTPDYHVPYANRFFRERFGESQGRRCFEYLFQRTEPCETCETYNVLKTMVPHRWEWLGPDGRNYDIYDFPFIDVDGSTLILEMGVDITELKQTQEELQRLNVELEQRVAERTTDLEERNVELAAEIAERERIEEAMRENEKRLSRAEEIAHLGSWELDLLNNKLSWSDEVYRIFGLQPQAFGATYEAFLESVHPDDRAAVDAAYSGSLREGRDFYEIEHRVVRRITGEVRWVHEKCEHIRDVTGRIIRSIGMVLDITERKQAEQRQLEAERMRAHMAENVVREINHRMKNNLMLITGLLELQLGSQPWDSEIAAILQQAKSRILAISTVHEQMYPQKSGQVEFSDVLQRITDLATGALATDQINVSVHTDSILISSRAASTLAVVVNELITNALKYGAPGPDGKRSLEVTLSHQDGKLGLRIWNSGNPIPADFDQARQAGLGLRICQELIEGQLQGGCKVYPQENGTMCEISINDTYLNLAGDEIS